MPTQIAGFDCFEVEFEREGRLHQAAAAEALEASIVANATSDLLVLAHGWNNDMAEARTLYKEWLASARAVLSDPRALVPGAAARRFAVMLVLWPSKRFTDEDLIAGGAAAMGGAASPEKLVAQIEELKKLFTGKAEKAAIDKAKALVPRLGKEAGARKEFVDSVRSLLTRTAADAEDGSDQVLAQDPESLLAAMSGPAPKQRPVVDPEAGGAAGMGARRTGAGEPAGGAAGLRDWLKDAFNGARNLLNYTTYYEMKARAGLIGASGVNPLLQKLRLARPDLKLHLIGHSFGGRLVAAAVDGPDHTSPLAIDTLTLLQAAFSHNGFAENYLPGKNGFFRRVVSDQRIRGAMVITFTQNDSAVGTAYPIASRLNRVDSAGMGDANDRFGGIGRNGAQKTPGAIAATLLQVGQPYAFKRGGIYSLEADRFIKNHSDVRGKEVAYATLCAVAAS